MKKRKKKIPLKKLLRRLEKKADKALSDYTRFITNEEFDACPFCKKKPIQCCFHFISRRRKILRWRADNVVGACNTCNFVERHWPDLSRAWYIRRYGAGKYLSLVDESLASFAPTQEYLEKTILTFQNELVKLKREKYE